MDIWWNICFLIPLSKQQIQTNTNQEFECKIFTNSFLVSLLLSHLISSSSLRLVLYDMTGFPFILLWNKYLLNT